MQQEKMWKKNKTKQNKNIGSAHHDGSLLEIGF